MIYIHTCIYMQIYMHTYIQGYCGDTMHPVLDHCNKVKVIISEPYEFFWFPGTYKSYVDAMLYFFKWSIALSLKRKKQFTYLNLKTLLKKNANHYLSFHMSCNLFGSVGSFLSVDDCWLIIRVLVADGWSDCGNFLK